MSNKNIGISKESQLTKNKTKNSKKLNRTEKESFTSFIYDKNKGKCQSCNIGRIGEFHHALYGYFGAKKDDRCLVGLCVKCHYEIHHGIKATEIHRQANIEKGKENYENYKSQK